MSWYRVNFEGENYMDVEAEYFEIVDGGVLAFYDTKSTGVTKERHPFQAFNEWNSVNKK
jgi:hypothetical protein